MEKKIQQRMTQLEFMNHVNLFYILVNTGIQVHTMMSR
jgi:hypothetical protein